LGSKKKNGLEGSGVEVSLTRNWGKENASIQ